VSALSLDDVRAWLDALKLAPRSFNHFARTLRTFFGFAKNRCWLSRDTNLLATLAVSLPLVGLTPKRAR
jgi:hypothetical protein